MSDWEPSDELVQSWGIHDHDIRWCPECRAVRDVLEEAVANGELVPRDSLGEVTFYGKRMSEWRDRAFDAEARLHALEQINWPNVPRNEKELPDALLIPIYVDAATSNATEEK